VFALISSTCLIHSWGFSIAVLKELIMPIVSDLFEKLCFSIELAGVVVMSNPKPETGKSKRLSIFFETSPKYVCRTVFASNPSVSIFNPSETRPKSTSLLYAIDGAKSWNYFETRFN